MLSVCPCQTSQSGLENPDVQVVLGSYFTHCVSVSDEFTVKVWEQLMLDGYCCLTFDSLSTNPHWLEVLQAGSCVFSFYNELKHLHGRLACDIAHSSCATSQTNLPTGLPLSLLLPMLLSPTKEYSENSKGMIQLRCELDLLLLAQKPSSGSM